MESTSVEPCWEKERRDGCPSGNELLPRVDEGGRNKRCTLRGYQGFDLQSLGFSVSAYLLEGLEGAVCEHPHNLLLLLHLLGCSVTQVWNASEMIPNVSVHGHMLHVCEVMSIVTDCLPSNFLQSGARKFSFSYHGMAVLPTPWGFQKDR